MSIWQNGTKVLPKKADDMTVRVGMEQDDISGRKGNMPNKDMNGMSIQHVGKSSGSLKG